MDVLLLSVNVVLELASWKSVGFPPLTMVIVRPRGLGLWEANVPGGRNSPLPLADTLC